MAPDTDRGLVGNTPQKGAHAPYSLLRYLDIAATRH